MKTENEIRKLRNELLKCITIGCTCDGCIIKLNEVLLLNVILMDKSPEKYFKALTNIHNKKKGKK